MLENLLTNIPPRHVYGSRKQYSAMLPRPRITDLGQTTKDLTGKQGSRHIPVPFAIKFPSPSANCAKRTAYCSGTEPCCEEPMLCSPDDTPVRNNRQRDSRNNIAMASLDHERALHEQRGRWRSERSPECTRTRTKRLSEPSKENLALPVTPSKAAVEPYPRSHDAGAHAIKTNQTTSHVERVSRSTLNRSCTAVEPDIFTETTNAPIPLDLTNSEEIENASTSVYMIPISTPAEPRLDFYQPTDPFADAILFDEPYAFRRRRILRNSEQPLVAFHLPTGSEDFQGQKGV